MKHKKNNMNVWNGNEMGHNFRCVETKISLVIRDINLNVVDQS